MTARVRTPPQQGYLLQEKGRPAIRRILLFRGPDNGMGLTWFPCGKANGRASSGMWRASDRGTVRNLSGCRGWKPGGGY